MILDLLKKFTTLWVILFLLALFPIFTAAFDLPFWNDVVMRIMLLGMAAMGLNIVFGFGGMVSFGHAAFMGIGAYCAGISQYYGMDNGWYQLLISMVTCGILGLVIGFLALRTTGIYFIMITLAFAQMLYFFFVSLEQFGGDDGLIMDRSDFIFIDLYEPLRLYYLIFFTLVFVSIVLMLLIRSRFGVILQAIKSNENRVEAMGLNPLKFKITGYVISAVICGVSGCLFASWQEFVSPDIMHWTRSGDLMIIIILGGLTYVAGPLVGAIVFLLLEELLPDLLHVVFPSIAENWMIIFGPLLIAVVLFGKGGLMGVVGNRFTRPSARKDQ
jgi:branched-chain amino acid transport system permease protein